MTQNAAGAPQADDHHRNPLEIRFLKELRAHTWALDAVSIEKQRAYAQRIQ